MDAYDREMEAIEDDYANGDLTVTEFNQAIREVESDYRAAAEESAQSAYDNEMERW